MAPGTPSCGLTSMAVAPTICISVSIVSATSASFWSQVHERRHGVLVLGVPLVELVLRELLACEHQRAEALSAWRSDRTQFFVVRVEYSSRSLRSFVAPWVCLSHSHLRNSLLRSMSALALGAIRGTLVCPHQATPSTSIFCMTSPSFGVRKKAPCVFEREKEGSLRF